MLKRCLSAGPNLKKQTGRNTTVVRVCQRKTGVYNTSDRQGQTQPETGSRPRRPPLPGDGMMRLFLHPRTYGKLCLGTQSEVSTGVLSCHVYGTFWR